MNIDRSKFKIHPSKLYLSIARNPFDEIELDILMSYQHRIEMSQKEEEKAIQSSYNDHSDEYSDFVAEEIFYTHLVSNIMFAALTVAMYAKYEIFVKTLLRACKAAKFEGAPKSFENFQGNADFLKKKLNITTDNIENYDTVNGLRCLSNTFKHNNGFYIETKKNIIPDRLKKEWDIKEKSKIDYTRLPFIEMTEECYVFCDELKKLISQEIRKKIE